LKIIELVLIEAVEHELPLSVPENALGQQDPSPEVLGVAHSERLVSQFTTKERSKTPRVRCGQAL
jgi:hypothetical protein